MTILDSLGSQKTTKKLKIRHSEYYNLIKTFDKLYQDSTNNKEFTSLMKIITSEENILLAYRNIKKNTGRKTSGIDKRTIKDIEKLSQEKYINYVQKQFENYNPKPVRRIEIPKPNGKTRPLGIPTIWDRILQQSILQVLEPICEAKFYDRSNGFRSNRSVEHAIAQCYRMMQQQQLHYVVDIDIKGFFDNVNHNKLLKQIWSFGIRDKKLLKIIKIMLKAPIQMPNNTIISNDNGTLQGGILLPLLSNIVLNELDWWISSQWENIPFNKDYKCPFNKKGVLIKSNLYRVLRRSNLKEMYIVRYADDFKIFCRNYEDAKNIFIATELWLKDRLSLEVSEEKSKIINLKKHYSEFLGFKMKVIPKGNKYVVTSHMCDKAKRRVIKELKNVILMLQKVPNKIDEYKYINLYNSTIWGIHNYYQYATEINEDCNNISYIINNILKIRLKDRLSKYGVLENSYIKRRYGKSRQMRYVYGRAICPIGYIQTKHPMYKIKEINKYTEYGRNLMYKELELNTTIMHKLANNVSNTESVEYMDNRISKYTAQYGKCAVLGITLEYEEIHCHHKIPKHLGGTDNYDNLIIVHKGIHVLIHAKTKEIINQYLEIYNLNIEQINKINTLRVKANLAPL